MKKLTILLLSLLTLSYAETSKHLLWQVKDADSEIYLLGSIHLADSTFYPLPSVIENKFTECSTLAVEADVANTDVAAIQKLAKEKGMFTGDESLKALLSADEYQLLKTEMDSLKIPIEKVDKMKPWLLVLTMAGLQAQKSGLTGELGIDIHFLKAAKDKKEIVELEGANFQIDMMSGFGKEEQKQFLIYSLKSDKEEKNSMGKIAEAWKKGDVAALKDLTLNSFKELPGIEKAFLFDRNVGMSDKSEKFLKDNKKSFVIVGAAHLLGDKGVLELLKKKGYKVEQL